MEVTQRLVGFALVAALLVASSAAQIIVQPGYTHPSVQVHQGYTGSPVHQSPASYQQSSRSLADEYQRNQVLQRMVENQILQMVHERQAQQLQQLPLGMVGHRLIHLPLRPRIGGGRLYSLTPNGIRGIHAGGFGLTRHPLLLREAPEPYTPTDYVYPARTQWTRSVSGGPGADFGSETEVHAVASESPVEGDVADGVDDLPEPQGLVAEDSIDKLVEPRHIGQSDDAIVGSPLDRIHYDQPFNHDQHHPMDSPAMSSQFLKTAHAIGQMIDTVAPGLMENKDPMSSMTRHQDPSGNDQQQHHHQPPSHQGERSESPSNWNAPGPSSNNQPMTGQSHQQPQNSQWGSMAPPQNPQNPSAKAADHERKAQQAPPTYPASNSPTNNWLTAAKQIFSGQPGYQNYPGHGYSNQQSGYNNYQPGYQNYQNRPQNAGYRPNGPPYNYGPSYPNGASSSATASASSFANNNNYNPYHRSLSNPYAGYNPYGFSGAVDQFGRAIMSQLPPAVNSLISNPNMNYFRNMAGQQFSVVKRPFGY